MLTYSRCCSSSSASCHAAAGRLAPSNKPTIVAPSLQAARANCDADVAAKVEAGDFAVLEAGAAESGGLRRMEMVDAKGNARVVVVPSTSALAKGTVRAWGWGAITATWELELGGCGVACMPLQRFPAPPCMHVPSRPPPPPSSHLSRPQVIKVTGALISKADYDEAEVPQEQQDFQHDLDSGDVLDASDPAKSCLLRYILRWAFLQGGWGGLSCRRLWSEWALAVGRLCSRVGTHFALCGCTPPKHDRLCRCSPAGLPLMRPSIARTLSACAASATCLPACWASWPQSRAPRRRPWAGASTPPARQARSWCWARRCLAATCPAAFPLHSW